LTGGSSGQTLQRDQIVVTGDAESADVLHSRDALVRMGPIAHQISGANVLVDILGGQAVEDAFERVEVAMNVG
jgi:hypothetical protein